LQVNDQIRGKEIRVISDDGEQLGIMSVREAMKIAEEKGMDLVKVAPNAKPPVCRIMDFGKYKYEQSKREKEARKKQTIINVKEVKMRPNIEEHDFQTKARNAERFLKQGDKVKVTIMFRGREITHPQLAEELLNKLAERVKDLANVEKGAKIEGKNMTMILAPKQQDKREKQD
jgi:translation initiation factor IF-3